MVFFFTFMRMEITEFIHSLEVLLGEKVEGVKGVEEGYLYFIPLNLNYLCSSQNL